MPRVCAVVVRQLAKTHAACRNLKRCGQVSKTHWICMHSLSGLGRMQQTTSGNRVVGHGDNDCSQRSALLDHRE